MRRLIPVLLALLLGACSHSPVMRLYEGDPRPETDVTVVRVPEQLQVVTINDRRIKGLNTLFSVGHKDLHLEPGRYRIEAYYKELWKMEGDSHTILESHPVTFEVNGEPGEFYRLDYPEPDNLEEARELKDNFTGWAVNTSTGEKIPTEAGKTGGGAGLFGSVSGLVDPPARETANVGPENSTSEAKGDNPTSDDDYLDLLKAHWSQATPEERRAFLKWVGENRQPTEN